MIRLVTIGAVFAFAVAAAFAQPGECRDAKVIGIDPRIAAQRQGSGLNVPYGMTELSDGSLLVATSDPTGGSFLNSTGRLVRLTDANADGAPQTLFNGLPGQVTAVRSASDLLLVTSAERGDETISILRAGAGDHAVYWHRPGLPPAGFEFYPSSENDLLTN